MKTYTFQICILLCLNLFSCNRNHDGKFIASGVQFINSGFEQMFKTKSPTQWKVAVNDEYVTAQVADVKHQGNFSLKIVGNPTDATTNLNFSQKLAINYKKVTRIRITAFIKTEQFKGSVALWYNIFDAKNREIDFGNSESSGVIATGTNDWHQYSMDVIVDKDATNLTFGAYGRGTGTIWFDDFAIEEYQGASAKPAPEVVKLNREFIDIVKKSSIYKDSIDWKAVDENLMLLSKGLKRPEDAIILNGYVLSRLREAGDYHSFIQNNMIAQNYASGKVAHPMPEAKLLSNGIGYVSVPSFGSINEEAIAEFAMSIQTLIKSLDSENDIKGWLVDLRTNGGGNMYPMISGLGPLLDIGNLGYFVKGNTSYPWKHTLNGMAVNIKNPYRVKKDNKIAVLIGPKTGSSGEMTAISFIGQHNTKLFGEPSGGYVTSNQMFKLSDESNLFLATSYVADRNHKKYVDKIYPDVLVKPTTKGDAVLQRAKSWLEHK